MEGPQPCLIWGQGHVYVFSQDENETCWLPERFVWCMEQRNTDPGVADDHPEMPE